MIRTRRIQAIPPLDYWQARERRVWRDFSGVLAVIAGLLWLGWLFWGAMA